MRKLDIGVASYRSAEKLAATLACIEQQTQADWECHIIHNPSEDDGGVLEIIGMAMRRNKRFYAIFHDKNLGYAGAVNRLLYEARTEYIAYMDNDVELRTPGWDAKLCAVLDVNPECGQVYPGKGHYGFNNGRYNECLWSAGYCWVLRREALAALTKADTLHRRAPKPGYLDESLGHHEEVDLMIRLRLAGYQIGCVPNVDVLHHETATRADDAVHQPGGRIHDGVVRWMNKWNQYFCGDQLTYSMTAYDPHALRFTDWPPCALYLERMTLANFPNWNKAPRVVPVPSMGNTMDAVEVLKPCGPYKGRAI